MTTMSVEAVAQLRAIIASAGTLPLGDVLSYQDQDTLMRAVPQLIDDLAWWKVAALGLKGMQQQLDDALRTKREMVDQILADAQQDEDLIREDVMKLRRALKHVDSEIMGQLTYGQLGKQQYSSQVYWAQVAGVAHEALEETKLYDKA